MSQQQKQTNYRQSNQIAQDNFGQEPRQLPRKVQRGRQQASPPEPVSQSKLKGKRAAKTAEKAVTQQQKASNQQCNSGSHSGSQPSSRDGRSESQDFMPQVKSKKGAAAKKDQDKIYAKHSIEELDSEEEDSSPMPSSVPNFLVKTYEIVNDEANESTVQWNSTGTGFVVNKSNEFAENVLPRYFKHNNFSSFVRQLNMYNFHKSRDTKNRECFRHENFVKGQKHLLALIAKKKKKRDYDKNNNMMGLPMSRMNHFGTMDPRGFGINGMPQLTDHENGTVEGFIGETKMLPQLQDEYSHQLENGYDLNATQAIMPANRQNQNLSIMPAGGFERQQRRRSSHETFQKEDDIIRLEKRLKEFEIIVSKLSERNEYTQGQLLMLINELKKYQDKDRHIEQVMLMALHLLVNLAGFNNIAGTTGGASSSSGTLLNDLFSKSRQVTTHNVNSPIPNRSETESQPGSVAHQKINTQGDSTRKGMVEELNIGDNKKSESEQDNEVQSLNQDQTKKTKAGFSPFRKVAEDNMVVLNRAATVYKDSNYQNQSYLNTNEILGALKDALNGNNSSFQNLNQGNGRNNMDWQYLEGKLYQVLRQMDPTYSNFNAQSTNPYTANSTGYKQFGNQHLLSQLFERFGSNGQSTQPAFRDYPSTFRNIPASPPNNTMPDLNSLMQMIQESSDQKQRISPGPAFVGRRSNDDRPPTLAERNSYDDHRRGFQMPSPRPNQYDGNPIDNQKRERGGPNMMSSGISEKNDDSYNFSSKDKGLNLNKQAFSPYKRDHRQDAYPTATHRNQQQTQQASQLINNKFEVLSNNQGPDIHERQERAESFFNDEPPLLQARNNSILSNNPQARDQLFPNQRPSSMKPDDDRMQSRLRAGSIGGDSSVFGGDPISQVDTNKFLRETPNPGFANLAATGGGHPERSSIDSNRSIFRGQGQNPSGTMSFGAAGAVRDFNHQASNPNNASEPSMVSQERSERQERNRNLEIQRQFHQLQDANQEQQQLIQGIIEGKITRKDILAQSQNQTMRNMLDRTYLGANSAISFEELSNSHKASESSRNLPMGRADSAVQSNISMMDQHKASLHLQQPQFLQSQSMTGNGPNEDYNTSTMDKELAMRNMQGRNEDH